MSSWLDVAVEAFVTAAVHRRPLTQRDLLEEMEAILARAVSRLVFRGVLAAGEGTPTRYGLVAAAWTESLHGSRRRVRRLGATFLGLPCRRCGARLTEANTYPSQRAKVRLCKVCQGEANYRSFRKRERRASEESA